MQFWRLGARNVASAGESKRLHHHCALTTVRRCRESGIEAAHLSGWQVAADNRGHEFDHVVIRQTGASGGGADHFRRADHPIWALSREDQRYVGFLADRRRWRLVLAVLNALNDESDISGVLPTKDQPSEGNVATGGVPVPTQEAIQNWSRRYPVRCDGNNSLLFLPMPMNIT